MHNRELGSQIWDGTGKKLMSWKCIAFSAGLSERWGGDIIWGWRGSLHEPSWFIWFSTYVIPENITEELTPASVCAPGVRNNMLIRFLKKTPKACARTHAHTHINTHVSWGIQFCFKSYYSFPRLNWSQNLPHPLCLPKTKRPKWETPSIHLRFKRIAI